MFQYSKNATPCLELLKEYEITKTVSNPRKLEFIGVDGFDVYNITSEFEDCGEKYIAGRVEKRETEISHVRIFKKVRDYTYKAVFPNIVFEKFQDPFITKIGDEIIIGGVQIETNPLLHDKIYSWKTCFFKGKTITELELFAVGPSHMKDIRLSQLANGKIGIFSRPQGNLAGLGKIGYIEVNSLNDLNAENILNAKIFQTHFTDGEWGGVNEIHPLENGLLGVLGHISYKCTDGKLHYHPMAFLFNPQTLEHTAVKIIARRQDISNGPSKRFDLVDVLFTGGIVLKTNKKSVLYTGVSDCEAYCVEIDNPFIKMEEK